MGRVDAFACHILGAGRESTNTGFQRERVAQVVLPPGDVQDLMCEEEAMACEVEEEDPALNPERHFFAVYGSVLCFR